MDDLNEFARRSLGEHRRRDGTAVRRESPPLFFISAPRTDDGDEPMINAAHNTTQACDLAAIIARGVARYVESLPDFARAGVPQYYGEPVTDEEAQVEFNVSRVTEDRQTRGGDRKSNGHRVRLIKPPKASTTG